MGYIPILFNTEMVQAILEGRKTQTRRVLKLKYKDDEAGFQILKNTHDGSFAYAEYYDEDESPTRMITPPCMPGCILWVRETWCENKNPNSQNFGGYEYRADYEGSLCQDLITWRPSIHMPKEAARIFLRVKDVRVERLQDITVLDAISEGCGGTICDHADAHPALGCTDCLNTGWLEPPDAEFAQLWDTTIKPADLNRYGWDANPWVWVIEFERCEKPEW